MTQPELTKEQLDSIVERISEGHELGNTIAKLFIGKDVFAIAVACIGVRYTLNELNPGVWETAEKLIEIVEEKRPRA